MKHVMGQMNKSEQYEFRGAHTYLHVKLQGWSLVKRAISSTSKQASVKTSGLVLVSVYLVTTFYGPTGRRTGISWSIHLGHTGTEQALFRYKLMDIDKSWTLGL